MSALGPVWVWLRGGEVMTDAGSHGGPGLAVWVSGEPEPGWGVARDRRLPDPLVEYDEEDLADPGGCEF
ncbi:hypothetical protein [Nonomuraea sp. SYSU D8015]|uniref:hypothetical protein n=1 Tax=Nonomuraea sp. SYSU D8015 TaxID=2593644 RepID=UPI0016608258|nr:hypothetical protein [Nonomuraea sp. SYSU D8015]